ncbi:MAG: helix-turn-helix transcriptional regulator [Cyanobacteriota bacterium]|nr:helix-turn-helix transcriptional regulator [Cyanobacteriota bacterium]
MRVEKVLSVEIPDLGEKIKTARKRDPRSLAEICRQVPMTTMNWYRIEKEQAKSIPVETLRRIEKVLGIDFNVKFEEDKD